VALILPTYKEKKSIASVISKFDAMGFIDDIVVVDNNAEKGTREEVAKTRARVVAERKQGYGNAIRKGIMSTKAPLVIIAEPDGSFDGKDVVKLLAYSDDFDMVFGSRTHLPLVQKGSDMRLYKRLGDVFLGRIITWLFLGPPLTDVGCTLRITSIKAWKKIESECKSEDGIFATEWLAVAAKNRIRFIEIPINYKARVGKSLFVEKPYTKGTVWGIRKFYCILKVWLYGILNKKLYE